MRPWRLPTMSANPITPLTVNEEFVLQKTSDFVDFQLWPIKSSVNPELWLSNFLPDEKIYALHLLNAFAYFSEALVDMLFQSAFQNLSALLRPSMRGPARKAAWQLFMDSVIVTYVTGEEPSATDSGLLFARKTRQVIGIPEARIVSPEQALTLLIANNSRHIVFVDDFVGSGQQFLRTWRRNYPIHGSTYSFEQFSTGRKVNIYHCPIFCSEYGLGNLSRDCPAVTISPANVLSSRYSVFDPQSLVWPDNLRAGAFGFLQAASNRAGIPDRNGGVDDWRGFHKLGLTLALSHSVPDATLPIFYWERNGWKPLIRRS